MAYVKTNWVDNTTPIDKNNLNKIESGIKNNDINIGEENYDNTKTYEVGDIVRYNEKIYKCITAITTAENFDISKWEQTNIVEIVQSEKSKIYELIEAISTPIVGEGENITLNDTAEKRFENFDIEGNSEQETREGYNLLDLTSLIGKTETKKGITYKINEDCSITVNGTPTDYVSFKLLDISLKAGTYKFTDGINKNNVFLQTLGNFQETSQNRTFSLAEDGNGTLYLVILAGTPTLNNTTLYPMIYEGTEDKPYEQYGAMPSPDYPSEVECITGNINLTMCNKNLAKINTDNFELTNNTIKSKSTTVGGNILTHIKLKAGQTITSNLLLLSKPSKDTSFSVSIGSSDVANLSFSKFDKLNLNTKQSKIYTATEDVEFDVKIWGNANKDIFEFQYWIELDNTTEYVQHKSQTYTIPVQQEMLEGDYFDFDNEEEVHNWNKLILNGTENWNMNVATSIFQLANIKATIARSGGLSNCYKYNPIQAGSASGLSDGEFAVQVVNGASYLYIRNNSITTLSDFKAYLKSQYDAGTPVVIYYKLATPTRLAFTDEQKAVAKKLNNARTYKNVTHIYSNDAVSPNFYVEAVKDLTTLIQ